MLKYFHLFEQCADI